MSLCSGRTLRHLPFCSRPRLAVLCECSRYSPASPDPSAKPCRSEKCLLRFWGGFFARSVQNTCIRVHDENPPRQKKNHALFSFCAKPVISRQKADGTMRFCVFDGSTEAHFGGGCEAGWRLCLCISLLNGGESPSPLKKAKCCSAVRRGAISGRQMLLNALHINDPSS